MSAWPETPPITGAEIDALVANEAFVVLHFWASWNGWDHRMDRDMRPVRGEFGDRAAFRSVDADRSDVALAGVRYRVMNLPAQVYFDHGRHICALLGGRSTEELRGLTAELIDGRMAARSLAGEPYLQQSFPETAPAVLESGDGRTRLALFHRLNWIRRWWMS